MPFESQMEFLGVLHASHGTLWSQINLRPTTDKLIQEHWSLNLPNLLLSWAELPLLLVFGVYCTGVWCVLWLLREFKRLLTPPIPLTCIYKEQRTCDNWRCCASRSVINDVDEAEFRNAIALVIWPFEVTTRNLHVTRSTCCWGLKRREVCEGTVLDDSFAGLRVSDSCLLCSQVWWGDWLQGQWFNTWLLFRQLKQYPVPLKMDCFLA